MDQAPQHKGHFQAILLALFVTFLWSTSWVLVKIGLKSNLPAITFAGLRYTLAFLCLVPLVVLHSPHRAAIRNLSKRTWLGLFALGVVFYALTQGAVFVSLSLIPAATLNLILNFSPVVVAVFAIFGGREQTGPGQWAGILISTVGVLIYFLPQAVPAAQLAGIFAGLVALLSNAGSSVLGRSMNSQGRLSPIIVTSISMGIGGLLMLLVGVFTQGWGTLDLSNWLIIGWLALVNTAFAFTLWNKTLQTLTAVESSILNGMMLPQIAILAWIFLGESLTIRQIIGISLVGIGTVLVQLWRYRRTPPSGPASGPQKSE